MTFTLLGGTEPHRVRTGVVSAGFFQFLGVQPVLGRTFAPDDEQAGAAPVLILSYEFWKKQERGDPNIIGKKYQMNDRAHLVIGVLPPIPQYPDENDVYMTTTSCPFRMRPAFIANRDAPHDARLRPAQTGRDHRPGARRSGLDRRPTGEGVPGIVHREDRLRHRPVRSARGTHARGEAAVVDPAGGGRVRPADRLRQRRQSDSGAHGAPRARTHHPHRDGRRRRQTAPPVADREPDSGPARRGRRRRVRVRQHGTAHQVRRPTDAAGARDLAGWLGARVRRALRHR